MARHALQCGGLVTPAAPTLLIDIGGTLLRRRGGGPVAHVSAVLAGLGLRPSEGEVARALQTGLSRDEAVAALQRRWPEHPDLAEQVRAALVDGEHELLPGAVEILRTARARGFRVLACTNATAWQVPPPPELSAELDGSVTSAIRGALKTDPTFWTGLVRDEGVDPFSSLVVGDSPAADVATPATVGIWGVLIGNGVDLPRIVTWLEALRPRPADAAALVGGLPVSWAGFTIWEAPHLAPLLERVTRRRVWLELQGGQRLRTTLVRRRNRAPALILDESTAQETLAWLTVKPLARPAVPPADVAQRLAEAGLSVDSLTPGERRQLFAMVREARDPRVRAQRIEDVLQFLNGAPR